MVLTVFDQKKYEDTIRRESKAEGEEKNRREMIQSMYKNGLSVEDISRYTDIDLKIVRKCISK